MLDSGRARTFHQSNRPEVSTAISVCPVDCMHTVGYDELKEMETARDDDYSQIDHRHLKFGQSHTPLNVAGIDSDANHKSSWYHHLKNKCFMSKACPQKACYDCPMHSEKGGNIFHKKKHSEAEHVRAQDFIQSGEADEYRHYFEL